MYNMYVLFDSQGRQKTKNIQLGESYLCGAKSDFLLYSFNVISSSHTAYFSSCGVIKDSIASVTGAITLVSLEKMPLDQLAPWTN